ncbi:MAG: hypothetical protein HY459_01965 [Parcubacteria group bacterium]|nr:hypothetical protein [Parcubacteria group bacterium]
MPFPINAKQLGPIDYFLTEVKPPWRRGILIGILVALIILVGWYTTLVIIALLLWFAIIIMVGYLILESRKIARARTAEKAKGATPSPPPEAPLESGGSMDEI